MIKDFKILDNIVGFRPYREPSVPGALNAASAIQSGFYLNKEDKCRMNEKVSVDKYVMYLLSLKSQKISTANYFCSHFFQKPNENTFTILTLPRIKL